MNDLKLGLVCVACLLVWVCKNTPADITIQTGGTTQIGTTIGPEEEAPSMPTFQSATSYTSLHDDPHTYAHNVGTGSDRVLIVCAWIEADGAVTIDGATYDGESMTQLLTRTEDKNDAKVYYLLDPNSGSNNVEVDLSGSYTLNSAAISFNGGTTPEAATQDSGTGSDIDTDITTLTANSMIVDCFSNSDAEQSITEDGGQTERTTADGICGASQCSGASTEPASTVTTYNLGWSWSASKRWIHQLAAVPPAP
jgi:hypothetical protein